jgi:hypothetical protein
MNVRNASNISVCSPGRMSNSPRVDDLALKLEKSTRLMEVLCVSLK